jgi:hypothetical protein
MAVYSGKHMKLTNTLGGQNAELLFVRAGGTKSYHCILKGLEKSYGYLQFPHKFVNDYFKFI